MSMRPAWVRRGLAIGLLGLAALPVPWARAQTAVAPQPAAAPPRWGAPVFVLNSLDGNVSVIDAIRWTEIKRIPTGKEPHHLYLTTNEKSVIVANEDSD